MKANRIGTATKDIRIMPSNRFRLKGLVIAALLATGPATAQDDPWYSGMASGFSGMAKSLGFRGNLPITFSMSGNNADGPSPLKPLGGSRATDGIPPEGTQANVGLSGAPCGSDALIVDAYRSCYGSTWSLAGVATLPVTGGLSLYGKLGLHNWQNGGNEEISSAHRSFDDLGRVLGIGLSYELSRAVTFRAESERYSDLWGGSGTGAGANLGLDASVHSIGLSIKF